MARLRRIEVFHSDEVAAVHVISRVVRQCYLLGQDLESGKNYDHRKQWIEQLLERFAGCFGIDLIAYSLMSNHMHQVLRSRPDVVATWDDTEVARRWLSICPPRASKGGPIKEPSEAELNSIRGDTDRLAEIRRRLSDISWWMRLLCQRIALRANREDDKSGHFWDGRFKSVRLLDEVALLACAAYVDLNPIRASMATTIEGSNFTSAQRRAQSLRTQPAEELKGTSFEETRTNESTDRVATSPRPDRFLSPVSIDERNCLESNNAASRSEARCSDRGFTFLSTADYLQLLDWTARRTAPGKRGATPQHSPPIFVRLKLQPASWCTLVANFGRLFSVVAGQAHCVDEFRTRRKQRFNLRTSVRQLLSD